MKKYHIDRQYGVFRFLRAPFGRAAFALGGLLMSRLPAAQKSTGGLEITSRRIASFDGEAAELYLFEPRNARPDKIFLFIHGGAFVFRGYKSHLELCKRFALEGGCAVVYVDYRLAYRHKYPVPLEDCLAAYRWTAEHAAELGASADRIVVGGDSAGGCLAADVAIRAVADGLDVPRGLMLLYPVLDRRMTSESMTKYADTPMWNSRLNKKMWELYLGGREYISPCERETLAGMPEAYIETAEFDCLHDEGVEFYEKLRAAGVKAVLNETKGTPHGFDMKKCDITEAAVQKRLEFLKSI